MNLAKIAAALRVLADALTEDPGAPASLEDPAMVEQEAVEPKSIELEDLQELGAAMIRGGKRPAFIAFLKKHNLKNLSALDPADYADAFIELGQV